MYSSAGKGVGVVGSGWKSTSSARHLPDSPRWGVPLLGPKATLQGDQAGLWLPWGRVRPNPVGREEVKIGSLEEGSLPRTLQKPENWSLLQVGWGHPQSSVRRGGSYSSSLLTRRLSEQEGERLISAPKAPSPTTSLPFNVSTRNVQTCFHKHAGTKVGVSLDTEAPRGHRSHAYRDTHHWPTWSNDQQTVSVAIFVSKQIAA